jgi:hypothetical protein
MSNGGPIPAPVVRILVALLALAAIVAFLLMFGIGILNVLRARPGEPPAHNEAFVYVATAVASLVGGIVAVGFGIKPPGGNGSRLKASVSSLGTLALPKIEWKEVIGSIYAIVYIILGIAAVTVWVIKPNETSALVKNLATTFLGLAIPIAAGFFRSS